VCGGACRSVSECFDFGYFSDSGRSLGANYCAGHEPIFVGPPKVALGALILDISTLAVSTGKLSVYVLAFLPAVRAVTAYGCRALVHVRRPSVIA
jgi:hypothetical protein